MSFLRRRGLLVLAVGVALLTAGVAVVLRAQEDDRPSVEVVEAAGGQPGGPAGPSSSPDSLVLAVRRATDLAALADRLDVPRDSVRQPLDTGLVDVAVPAGTNPADLRASALD